MTIKFDLEFGEQFVKPITKYGEQFLTNLGRGLDSKVLANAVNYGAAIDSGLRVSFTTAAVRDLVTRFNHRLP